MDQYSKSRDPDPSCYRREEFLLSPGGSSSRMAVSG